MPRTKVSSAAVEAARHTRAMKEALDVAIDALLVNPYDGTALAVVDILGKRLGSKLEAGSGRRARREG